MGGDVFSTLVIGTFRDLRAGFQFRFQFRVCFHPSADDACAVIFYSAYYNIFFLLFHVCEKILLNRGKWGWGVLENEIYFCSLHDVETFHLKRRWNFRARKCVFKGKIRRKDHVNEKWRNQKFDFGFN